MTIRYRRVGLKIERVPTDELEAALQVELGAAQQELDAVAEQANDLRRRLFPKTPVGVEAPGPSLAAQDVLRARQLVGLSQRDLAAQLHLHRSSIAEVERGQRRPQPRLTHWAAGVLRASQHVSEVAS